MSPEELREIAEAMPTGMIICYTRCMPCMHAYHYDPPQIHSWMDDEDIDHARETGQDADPDKHPCGCHCAREGDR